IDAAAVTQLLQPQEGGAAARGAGARILPAVPRQELGRDPDIVETDDALLQHGREPMLLELAPFRLGILLSVERLQQGDEAPRRRRSAFCAEQLLLVPMPHDATLPPSG